jgi:hypothetical protein
MPNRVIDPDLRDKVFAAVDAAEKTGTVSRPALLRQFENSGLARATIYRWVESRIKQIAIEKARKSQPVAVVVAKDATRAIAALGKADGPIEFAQLLHQIINDLLMVRAMSLTEDGKLRNPRLLMESADRLGKALDRAARIGAIMRDQERESRTDLHAQFMDEILDLVMAELPDKRDRILSQIEGIRQKFAAMS